MTQVNIRDAAEGVIAALASVLPVGYAEKPDARAWQAAVGTSTVDVYAVLWSLAGRADGTLGRPFRQLLWPFQLTIVSAHADLIPAASDRIRATLVTSAVTVTGARVLQVAPYAFGYISRDDTESPPLWYSPDEYRIRLVPA